MLLGVLCAGQIIGWRLVARNLMLTVNCGTLLIGLGMQAVAGAMRAASATVCCSMLTIALLARRRVCRLRYNSSACPRKNR